MHNQILRDFFFFFLIFVDWNSSEINAIDCFSALPSKNAQNSTNNAVPKMHSPHLLLFILVHFGWLGILLTSLASEGCYLKQSGPSIMLQNPARI